MKKMILLGIASSFLAMNGTTATAEDFEAEGRNVRRFNMVCYYHNGEHSPFGSNCRAAVTFLKKVSPDGGEVIDNNPNGVPTGPSSYSVTCDANPINPTPSPLDPVYNDGGLRFTDLLGTKIQGVSGPTPTVFLNRGSLHAGTHVAESWLELTYANTRFRSKGQCSIWTVDADYGDHVE